MKIALRFYYTAGSALSEDARHEIKKIKEKFPEVKFEVEELDMILNIEMAEQDGILATPTMIRFSPLPVLKIVGDFKNLEKLLDLHHFRINGN